MDSFYKTSLNLKIKPFLTQKSDSSPNKQHNINISDSYKSPYLTHSNFFDRKEEKQKIYFPYHLFSNFSISFEKDNSKRNINIPKTIINYKQILKNDEELLQKIASNELANYLRKLNYGPDFFIQFAKRKKELLDNEKNKPKAKKDKPLFKSRYLSKFKTNKPKKKIDFYEMIIKQTNDKYNDILKHKKNKNFKNSFNKSNSHNISYTINNVNNKEENKNIFLNILKNNKNNKSKLKILNQKTYNKERNYLSKVIRLKKNINPKEKLNIYPFDLINTKKGYNTNRINNKKNIFLKYNRDIIQNKPDNKSIPYSFKNYSYNSNKNLYNSKYNEKI